MITELFAVCLLVKDFDSSLAFYRDILGLKVNSLNGKFADFELAGSSLAVFEKSEATAMLPARYMRAGGGCVLAFQVEDVVAVCKQLQAQGIEIMEGPKVTPWGQTVAYFLDPDQHIWELSQSNGA